MARFSTILFDLGNTLLYFDGVLEELLQVADRRLYEALVELGYPLEPPFMAAFRANLRAYFVEREVDFHEGTVEQVLRATMRQVGCPEATGEHQKTALRAMYTVTQAHWRAEAEALPVLAELRRRGYRLGLISNAADLEDLRGLIVQNGLADCFEQVLISAEVGYRKPHPYIFRLALEHFGVPPNQVAMVGDTLGADVLGAQRAGMAAVWVTRRAQRPDNLALVGAIRPDRSIESLAELPGLFEGWDHKKDPRIK